MQQAHQSGEHDLGWSSLEKQSSAVRARPFQRWPCLRPWGAAQPLRALLIGGRPLPTTNG